MKKEELKKWIDEQNFTESAKKTAYYIADLTCIWKYSDRKKLIEELKQKLT